MSCRPDNESSLDREPTPTEQAALVWVVRCERGLTSEEERAFAEWIEAHPKHHALFAEFGGTWTLMGNVGKLAATTAGPRRTELSFEHPKDVASRLTAKRHRGRNLWLTLAAAAAIAIAAVGWWRPAREESTIVTDVGASRKITLADGSVVELNTDSKIVSVFTAAERRVRLAKGEAYFQVTKDAHRPFVVEAGGVGVRAIGTAFNVRVRAETVEVLVTEGTVRVTPDATGQTRSSTSAGRESAEKIQTAAATPSPSIGMPGSKDVSAGERVIVPVASVSSAKPAMTLAVARVPDDEVRRTLAWQGQRLDFSDTPLAEMVAEFNRYNRHTLVVADARLASLRFGGSFRSDDQTGFVRMLRENFGVVAEERDDRTVLRSAR